MVVYIFAVGTLVQVLVVAITLLVVVIIVISKALRGLHVLLVLIIYIRHVLIILVEKVILIVIIVHRQILIIDCLLLNYLFVAVRHVCVIAALAHPVWSGAHSCPELLNICLLLLTHVLISRLTLWMWMLLLQSIRVIFIPTPAFFFLLLENNFLIGTVLRDDVLQNTAARLLLGSIWPTLALHLLLKPLLVGYSLLLFSQLLLV